MKVVVIGYCGITKEFLVEGSSKPCQNLGIVGFPDAISQETT